MTKQGTPPDFGFGVELERRRTKTSAGLAIAALGVCVSLVIGMAFLILGEIEDLSRANSDNLQWSLAQVDVEFLRYNLALENAENTHASMLDVRQRFNVFYSRVNTVESGTVYQLLRDDPAFDAPRKAIQDLLNHGVPVIDGPDAALWQAIPDLRIRAEAVIPEVRSLALAGLTTFAEVSDRQREALLRNLLLMASVLALVFATLTLLAYLLYRLYRLAETRAREVLRTGERMRTIVETSPEAIIMTDGAGAVREFNPLAERIFGYSREAARNLNAIDLIFPPDIARDLRGGLLSFFETNQVPTEEARLFETEAIDYAGNRFPAELAIVKPDTGPVYITYVRDISRRKAAERELTHARDRALAGERAKAEFLAVMSHEMRTPLNGLLGTMQLMRDHALSERQTELLERMDNSGRLLLGLVNDVLDLSKFEAGKLSVENQSYSVTKLLDGVVETASALASANGNSLSWDWVGNVREQAVGDARRLRQILLNLVGNAIKFTRDGLVIIEVEAMRGSEMLEFRVIDSGIGIAEKDFGRIFNDFETLDSSYARQAGGTGLGLGIVRRLVSLMGGEIGVESEEGEGSIFWVRVPANEPVTNEKSVRNENAVPKAVTRSLDILLVEDNETNRFVARQMLVSAGHRVIEAENGLVGFERAQAQRFDVILMDISMPVMDGPEATRRIRGGDSKSAGTPIIAVTAHALSDEIASFRKAGMDGYISKPVNRAELISAIADVLDDDRPEAPKSPPVAEGGKDEVVNVAQLEEFLSILPEDRRAEMFQRYIAEIDQEIGVISASEADADGLQACIHQCAGSCGTLGAAALLKELNRLEAAMKRGQSVTRADLGGLAALWQQSREAMVAIEANA